MNENFDCTQFITFNYEGTERIESIVRNIFKDSVFTINYGDAIRTVKKEYLKHYLEGCLFELEHKEFMGEFEDWEVLSQPTPLVNELICKLYYLFCLYPIKNAKVILVLFAEFGNTKDAKIYVNLSDIRDGLFKMSMHCFDVWADTLIIELL